MIRILVTFMKNLWFFWSEKLKSINISTHILSIKKDHPIFRDYEQNLAHIELWPFPIFLTIFYINFFFSFLRQQTRLLKEFQSLPTNINFSCLYGRGIQGPDFKGQLISKANFEVFIWTKNWMKIFLYFCPSSLKWAKSKKECKIIY